MDYYNINKDIEYNINEQEDIINMPFIKSIFEEILQELSSYGYSKSVADDATGINKFYLIIPQNKLKIDKTFYLLLKAYLEKIAKYMVINKDSIKYLIIKLFMRICSDDLNDINSFLYRQICYIEDRLFYTVYNFMGNKMRVLSCDAIGYESPTFLKITISDKEDAYTLPSVFYGIDKNVCNVYAIQNLDKPKNSLQKKYNRLFYRFNENIQDKFMGFNIKDVTMSFLFSAFVFLYQVQKSGITKVKINAPLPVFKYNKINQIAEKKLLFPEQAEELDIELKRILENTSDKYYATFIRLCYHFSNLLITKIDEKGIYIEIGPFIEKSNNPLFNYFLDELNKKDERSALR